MLKWEKKMWLFERKVGIGGNREQGKCDLYSDGTYILVGRTGIELVTGVRSVWKRQRQDALEASDGTL